MRQRLRLAAVSSGPWRSPGGEKKLRRSDAAGHPRTALFFLMFPAKGTGLEHADSLAALPDCFLAGAVAMHRLWNPTGGECAEW